MTMKYGRNGKHSMRTIAAGEFKAKCLALMDEVRESGETILITKRGKPVAQLSRPIASSLKVSANRPIFGFMSGQGVILGDIVGPIVTEDEWDHLSSAVEPSTAG